MAPAPNRVNMNIITSNMNNNKTELNNSLRRVKFGQLLQEEMMEEKESSRYSNASEISTTSSSSTPRLSSFCNYVDDSFSSSTTPSPYYNNNHHNDITMVLSPSPSPSPWSQPSPYTKSPWIKLSPYPNPTPAHGNTSVNNIYIARGKNCLIGSLLREEGHVYSLAVNDGMLYTGSESKNIRVWKEFHDAGGFKSGSGLVKAIVVARDRRVFTGHQDGKIRVWSSNGKRVGTLPRSWEYLRSCMNPKNYVEVRRHQKVPRMKHFDAVSCMSLNEDAGLLYSGSWDKSIKVWKVSDGKCVESFEAHEDAINSIVVGFDGLVFSGGADGTVKVWKRELHGKNAKHFQVRSLLEQEKAVTALAVAMEDGGFVLYGGSSDGLVNFWEREKEELCYGGVLRGHKLAVLCLGTAGRLVLSGSADKTICVWKREEGGAGVHTCLAVLTGHSGPVKCLAVEQDRQGIREDEDEDEDHQEWIVYSGSLDKSVKVWRVAEDAPDDELRY